MSETTVDLCYDTVRYFKWSKSMKIIVPTAIISCILITLWRYVFTQLLKGVGGKLATQAYGELKLPEFFQDKKEIKSLLDKIFNKLPKYLNIKKKLNYQQVHKIKKQQLQQQNGKNVTFEEDKDTPLPEEEDSNKVELQQICNEIKSQEISILELRLYLSYRRKELDIHRYIHKYCEELWKVVHLGMISIFGFYVMYYFDGFYDPYNKILLTFPQKEIDIIMVYYYISIGYHLHRAIFQFFDHVRSDFLANCIHHWVTVCLITFSEAAGVTQIGSIVLACHDSADFFLGAAKISKYHKLNKLKDLFFVFFFIDWIGLRLVLFPYKVILPIYWSLPYLGCNYYYGCQLFLLGLCILYVLHCYWFTLIFKIFIDYLHCINYDDIRSDQEIDNKNNQT